MTERRVVILRAAQRLVWHYGPAKTTVAEIAREARIGVGSVYLEFTSKNAIVEALSEAQHLDVLEAERRAWLAGGSVRERLERVFEARFDAFARAAQGPSHARDLLLCDSVAVQAVHARFRRAEEGQTAAMLREAVQAGELRPMDAEATARALLHAYAAFAPPLMFREPIERMRQDLAGVHRLVLGAI